MRQTHRLKDVPFVIIGLNKSRNETEVLKAHGFTDIVECLDVWNVHRVTKYAVFFNGPQQLQNLIHIGKDFDQEKLVIVDSDRRAKTLDLKTGDNTKVGSFKAVTEAEALHSGEYIYVESMETYFKAGA